VSAASPAIGASGLERLRVLLRAGGGLMATLVVPDPPNPPAPRNGDDGAQPDHSALAAHGAPNGSPSGSAGLACLAARGPRAASRREEYELLVEAIYEGYLLHYSEPRVVRVPEADLRLLAGDQLYALGLARLVALGDTVAVAELADTITLSALAQGAGKPELADAVWEAGARAVGWGSSGQHDRAKELVLGGRPGALEAMRTSAKAPATPS
jgi:hypothetical protein